MAQGSEGTELFLSMVERRRQARLKRFGAALSARRNALEFRQELIQQRMRQLEHADGLVASLAGNGEGDERGGGRASRSAADSDDPRSS